MVASQFVGSGRVQVPVIGQECAKRFEYYGASVNVERPMPGVVSARRAWGSREEIRVLRNVHFTSLHLLVTNRLRR